MTPPPQAAIVRRTSAPPQPDVRPPIIAAVDAFRRILRALRVASRKTQMEAGISAAQLFVLQTLANGRESSLTEIASRTLTDRSSVAAVVDRLLDAGLVSREPARRDRRRAAIAITAAGRAVMKRAPESPTALLVAGLDTLSDRQLRSLANGLGSLTSAMGLSEERAGMLFEDMPAAAMRPRIRRPVD